MDGKSLQDATKSPDNVCLWLGRIQTGLAAIGVGVSGGRQRVGLEKDVVRECAVQITLNMLAVVVRQLASVHLLEQLAVKTGIAGKLVGATSIPEPSSASPLGWDPFADVFLDFVRLGREAGWILSIETVFLHECIPLEATLVQIIVVRLLPLVETGFGDVLRLFLEAVTVALDGRNGRSRGRGDEGFTREGGKVFAGNDLSRGSDVGSSGCGGGRGG